MQLHDKTGYKNAIIVDAQMLKELDECIKKYFEVPQYSADLLDKSHIYFDSLDELLIYDNFADKRIENLKISFGYSSSLYFKPTVSFFNSYKYSVSAEYITNSIEDSILFKNEFVKILGKKRRPCYHTFITKFSIFYLLVVLIIISLVFYGILFFDDKLSFNNDIPLSVTYINFFWISLVVFFGGTHITSKIRNKIFPIITFKLGEQIYVHEKNEKFKNNIFWGIIVASIISILITLLFQ